MTPDRNRWVGVALVTILTWSVVLGAAMPAAAVGSSSSGDGSAVRPSLDLGGTVGGTVGDTVDTVTGETKASSDSGGESGPNATVTPNSSEESITGVVDRTTGGLGPTVDEVVQTRTPTPTPAPTDEREEPTTATATPTADSTPGSDATSTLEATPGSDGGEIDLPEEETAETRTGDPTPEETPTGAADVDGDENLVGTTADLLDGVGTVTTGTVDETVSGTTDTVQETTNSTGRTVENTTNDTGSAVDGTVRTVTGDDSDSARAVDGLTDLTNDTVGNVTDQTNDTVGDVTDQTNDTVGSTSLNADETVRTVGATTGDVENGSSSGSPGNLVADTVGGVTRTVDATVSGTVVGTSAVTTSVDETVSTTTELFDDGNGTVARLVGNVTATVDTATGGLTAVVDDTTRTVQRTTETVTDGVDGTAETTGRLVDDTVEGDVTGGVFGPGEEKSENTEAYGWPPEEPVSSSDDGTAAPGATGEDASAAPARLASAQASSSEGSDDGPEADDAASSTGGDVLPSLDEVDPATGGAIAGALLVSGSFAATRAGMTASSMGAGAATLPQLLVAMFREFGLRLAVLAGYSRYDFSDPLENDNRATVLETVEASPGINLTSLVEETGLAESTVRYHVQVLEHEGLLDGAKVRGRRRFVPQTNVDVELVAAFEEDATRDVIDALLEHEPATGTTLAEALDRDPSTVSHHLSRLSEAGLVDREQDGPALRNSLSADVRAALSDVEVVSSVQQHVQADD